MADGNMPGLISTSQAAKMLEVSDEWIRRLEKMGYVTKRGRGAWHFLDVIRGYIRYLKDDSRRSSKSASASRMQDVKTERLEFELKVAKAAYQPVEDMFLALDTLSSEMRGSFGGVGARLTRDAAWRNKIDDEITATINRMSERIERTRDALVEASGGTEDPEEDDPG